MATRNPTSYGLRTVKLSFDGSKSKYKLWEAKFLGYIRILTTKVLTNRQSITKVNN